MSLFEEGLLSRLDSLISVLCDISTTLQEIDEKLIPGRPNEAASPEGAARPVAAAAMRAAIEKAEKGSES